MSPKQRALFLIDGSNFYHNLQSCGISKGDLDYAKLAKALARDREVVGIRFYTCPVMPAGSARAVKQQRFFSRMIKTGVKLELGTLVDRERTCPACGAVEPFRLEKGVDVLLAMTMVKNAIEDRYDVVYLLSCDADYAPAARFVRERGKKVFLVAPKGSKYGTLKKDCDAAIPIGQDVIDQCQAE